ncbi:MAG: redoxin domain-containing protein [bacterium]|nr:redoxin domain-containing protein [bacterium]
MRDAYPKFQAAGIELYAISYDDQEVLTEFSAKQNIPFRLLSDLDSEVIRRYGILNDQVGREDAFLEGIPYPGVYVTDEEGVVIAKFFHDSYKERDSPEMLIDAALGRLLLSDDEPSASGGDEEVRISAVVHGGKGTIRQGIRRQLIVRFELGEGVHIYGEPVPEGMIPTSISVSAPPGLVLEDPIYPPTETLRIESMDMELPVWSGTVDIVLPFMAIGELASETRPLDMEHAEIEVGVRYQACDDNSCFPPKTEKLKLHVDLDVIDVPALSTHMGHGQREAEYNGMPHMFRLIRRKARKYPLGMLRLIFKTIRLEWAALRRLR